MTDFRNLQDYIAAIRVSPSAEESNEEGYLLLRRCVAEAQTLLAHPFQAQSSTKGDQQQVKLQLQRIILDAAVRRFKTQKIYLCATAALRWVNSRAAILQGQRPQARHVPALQQIRHALRAEVASITDQRVELSLRAVDASAGKWLVEDPSLAVIQRLVGGNAPVSGR